MPAPTVFNLATGQWCHGPAIAAPANGSTIDAEARTAVTAILGALRNASVIAGATRPASGFRWNEATRQIVLGPDIVAPSGGAIADSETRAAIGGVLGVLRSVGILGGGTHGPQFVLDPDTHQWASAAVSDVTGGTTADAECRTALNGALAAMRSAELIA